MDCFNKKKCKALSIGRLLSIVFLSASLLACSSNDDEDESTRIAELNDLDNAFDVEVIWEQSVGGVDDYFSRIKPVVAYDKVFSASRIGDVVAYDKSTGNKIWQTDLSDISDERSFWDSRNSALIAGGPSVGMNKVFVGTENGDIFALEADTGTLVWQVKVKGEVITPPAFDSGVLVVNTASGILKALDASNGQELWKVEQDVPALTLRGISSPVIASGGVLVGTGKGELGVYILDKGQAGWTTEVGEATGSTELQRVIDVDAAPVVFGDKVYAISARGNLVAIELKSGRILWKRQYSSYRQIAVYRNDIFITNTRGHVYALNRLNGIERWSNVELNNRSVTGPVIVDQYIVVGDFEGYLHWLDQETGEIVSRHKLDSSGLHATPTVSDSIIYSQSRDGDLQAIATPTSVAAE
jgi:outer membrane protein assembly factor BamB